MLNDLTNDQISLLCDLEEHDLFTLAAQKRADLERLISDGYVGPAESILKVTAKGMKFLGERGAGLDEA
ncbi:MAG: hypothetical protein WBE48_06940 [Xanthobacteraceae bacterium]|jgi:hypothetical protein